MEMNYTFIVITLLRLKKTSDQSSLKTAEKLGSSTLPTT